MAMHVSEVESGVLSRDDCMRLKTLLRALAFATQDDGVFPIYLDFNVGVVEVLLQTGIELEFSFCITADVVQLRSEEGSERLIKVADYSTRNITPQ